MKVPPLPRLFTSAKDEENVSTVSRFEHSFSTIRASYCRALISVFILYMRCAQLSRSDLRVVPVSDLISSKPTQSLRRESARRPRGRHKAWSRTFNVPPVSQAFARSVL